MTLTRFTVPLNPGPDDNFYDRRDAAAEDKAKIRRDDKAQSSSDRDLNQALAYAKPFNAMLEQIFQIQTGDKPTTEGKNMRNTIKDGGPAFPRAGFETNYPTDKGNPVEGMSLRDWFAGMVLQGVVIPNKNFDILNNHKEYAEHAYLFADAMLVQREKGTPTP